MQETHKSPKSKPKERPEVYVFSPPQHTRGIKSSEGFRLKADAYKAAIKSGGIGSDEITPEKSIAGEAKQPAAINQRYRIKTSSKSSKGRVLESRGQGRDPKLAGESRTLMDTHDNGAQISKIIDPLVSRDFFRAGMRHGVLDKEKLYEDTINLKTRLNQLQEENTKLKTRNTHLENEACKFEKMVHQASIDPKKQSASQTRRAEMEGVNLKLLIRDLRNELDENKSELISLKKKLKTTKIQELEVQVGLFEAESLKLRAYIDKAIGNRVSVAAYKIMNQEAERNQPSVQSSDVGKMKRDFELLLVANKAYEKRCEENERQIVEQEKRLKREHGQSAKSVQQKDREIAKLKEQLSAASKKGSGAPATGNDDKYKREYEKATQEKMSLKSQLEKKDEYILGLERQVNELTVTAEKQKAAAAPSKQFLVQNPAETQAATISQASSESEAEMKKLVSNPSYGQVGNKEAKVAEPLKPSPPERKINQEDAKRIGYQINLAFRAKDLSFDDINKLDWPKSSQKIDAAQLSKLLKDYVFGLKNNEDVNILTTYLIQESSSTTSSTSGVDNIKSILTGVIGPIPYWDDDTKKKLDSDLATICVENRKSFEEALKKYSNNQATSKKGIEEAIKAINVVLSFAQIEYLVTKLFEVSHDANQLPIDAVFKIFSANLIEKQTQQRAPSAKASKEELIKESPREYDEALIEEDNDSEPSFNVEKHQQELLAKNAQKPDSKNKIIADDSDEERIADDPKENIKAEIQQLLDDDDDEEGDHEPSKPNYAFLSPDADNQNHEKITERGEDEEEEFDEDDYKDDHSENSDKGKGNKALQPSKEARQAKPVSKKESEDDKDGIYDDEEESQEQEDAPAETKKSQRQVVSEAESEKGNKKKTVQNEEEEDYEAEQRAKSVKQSEMQSEKQVSKQEIDEYEAEEYDQPSDRSDKKKPASRSQVEETKERVSTKQSIKQSEKNTSKNEHDDYDDFEKASERSQKKPASHISTGEKKRQSVQKAPSKNEIKSSREELSQRQSNKNRTPEEVDGYEEEYDKTSETSNKKKVTSKNQVDEPKNRASERKVPQEDVDDYEEEYDQPSEQKVTSRNTVEESKNKQNEKKSPQDDVDDYEEEYDQPSERSEKKKTDRDSAAKRVSSKPSENKKAPSQNEVDDYEEEYEAPSQKSIASRSEVGNFKRLSSAKSEGRGSVQKPAAKANETSMKKNTAQNDEVDDYEDEYEKDESEKEPKKTKNKKEEEDGYNEEFDYEVEDEEQ